MNMHFICGIPNLLVHCVLTTVATSIIEIERRFVDVIESQTFVEVCLVKSQPSSRPLMALVNAKELTGNVGSPGGPFIVYTWKW